MMSKTEQVRELLAWGQNKQALKIGKSFTRGLSKDDMAAIRLAYEAMVYPEFYRQLKVDVQAAVDIGVKTLTKLVELKEKADATRG